jgi:transposase
VYIELEGRMMMGRLVQQDALFYEFNLEGHVPQVHLLRKIDQFLDFDQLCTELAHLYSHTGRPSIDPELMIYFPAGYCAAMSQEDACCSWDISTAFARKGSFASGDILRRVFESIVRTFSDHGLVGGTGALIDGSTVFACCCQLTMKQNRRNRTRRASRKVGAPHNTACASCLGPIIACSLIQSKN